MVLKSSIHSLCFPTKGINSCAIHPSINHKPKVFFRYQYTANSTKPFIGVQFSRLKTWKHSHKMSNFKESKTSEAHNLIRLEMHLCICTITAITRSVVLPWWASWDEGMAANLRSLRAKTSKWDSRCAGVSSDIILGVRKAMSINGFSWNWPHVSYNKRRHIALMYIIKGSIII